MDEKINSIEESFQIINRIIDDEKVRLNENGFIYLFWGWLTIFCAAAQSLLIYLEIEKHYYIWFVMLVGWVYTMFYFGRKKERKPMPLMGRVLAFVWNVAAVNIFIFSFVFPITAGQLLMFFILTILGLAASISGMLIRFQWLTLGGLLCNALAFTTIVLEPKFWNLILIFAIIFAIIIPGYMLRAKYRKQNVQ